MKFTPDTLRGPSVTGYGPDWVAINGETFQHSIIINSQGLCQPWACLRFEDLNASHFEILVTLGPELVLFGSGSKLRFPPAQWLAALYERRIGVETMDTPAACRTYNFLSGEGRKVAAALIV